MKIVKRTIAIDVAKLVHERGSNDIEISDEVVATLEQIATELLGGGYVIEAFLEGSVSEGRYPCTSRSIISGRRVP